MYIKDELNHTHVAGSKDLLAAYHECGISSGRGSLRNKPDHSESERASSAVVVSSSNTPRPETSTTTTTTTTSSSSTSHIATTHSSDTSSTTTSTTSEPITAKDKVQFEEINVSATSTPPNDLPHVITQHIDVNNTASTSPDSDDGDEEAPLSLVKAVLKLPAR